MFVHPYSTSYHCLLVSEWLKTLDMAKENDENTVVVVFCGAAQGVSHEFPPSFTPIHSSHSLRSISIKFNCTLLMTFSLLPFLNFTT